MKFKELQIKDTREIELMLAKAREELQVLQFKISAGQLKDVREIRENKKMIAKILTLLNQRKKQPPQESGLAN